MITGHSSGMALIAGLTGRVFPLVNKELSRWSEVCSSAEDEMLRNQALDSIKHKKFHIQGGSVYALYPKADLKSTIRFITAFQTISDYLDNLCDRAGIQDEASFRQLHLSMLDAVDPDRRIGDYYMLYPYKRDGGYLSQLVQTCREQIKLLPSYRLVKENIIEYVRLYTDLQCYKHLSADIREEKIISWANSSLERYPGISVWEFSAAAGSTLCVFLLFAAAWDTNLTEGDVEAINAAYFPWICGLHILLDYYIDEEEDMRSGDLNFTHYYDNLKQCEERLSYFTVLSLEHCKKLRHHRFHTTVVRGLLALYLSDMKASAGMKRLASRSLAAAGGASAQLYHFLCSLFRRSGVI